MTPTSTGSAPPISPPREAIQPFPASTAPRARGSLHRRVWRWHFFAGLIVGPVLLVMAATGALYLFKNELEVAWHPDWFRLAPRTGPVSYESILETARQHCPPGYEAARLEVPSDPSHSVEVLLLAPDQPYRRMLLDPYSPRVLGQLGGDDFFAIVLRLHRTLWIGQVGRVLTELTTCWTLILLVTGAYLWWPRRGHRRAGVWWPRLAGKRYTLLRDWHSVCGVYFLPVAAIIALTGLLYTQIWGAGYQWAALQTGAYRIFTDPPQSVSPPADRPASLDAVVGLCRQRCPDRRVSLDLPDAPQDALVAFLSRPHGPSISDILIIDRWSGALLEHRPSRTFPALGWWANWNYPLHVGSVLGLPTKLLWLIACLVLMLLPATGAWMWWTRRPRGSWGVPRKSELAIPSALSIAIVSMAFLMPVAGLSLVAALILEQAMVRWSRHRRTRAA